MFMKKINKTYQKSCAEEELRRRTVWSGNGTEIILWVFHVFWETAHEVTLSFLQFVGNKAKGRIWKQVFQEKQSTYQRVGNVCFSENLACFVFLKHPFWDSPFCLITEELFVSKRWINQPQKSDMTPK